MMPYSFPSYKDTTVPQHPTLHSEHSIFSLYSNKLITGWEPIKDIMEDIFIDCPVLFSANREDKQFSR